MQKVKVHDLHSREHGGRDGTVGESSHLLQKQQAERELDRERERGEKPYR